jgi:spermidine/putrescine transport system substrate-binding protein
MNTLTLLTWPNYINPKTIEQFESEFDAKVNLDIVPSAIELIERMKTAGRVARSDSAGRIETMPDVLVPPDYVVRELGAEDRLAVLDHAKLSNFEHLEKRFQTGRAHDALSRISLVKDWGTMGFMFRTDVVHEHPASWKDFWALAEKYSRRVTVLDSPGEVIGAVLKMRGHSYNAASVDEISAAREDLLKLKPHLLAFETNYKPLLSSGEACLSLGWNGDAAALIAQGVPIKYIIPIEGSQIWEDDWAIAADAPNPELAHTFLNFVMRPEIAAQEARYTRYATGNRSALALLDEEMRNDPSTYPPREVLSKLEEGMPLGAAGQVRREVLWREFRF